ncbi:MAG: hypothetical protein WCA49_05805 [Candidatus Sulfotelmatobacter sp.]
MKFTFWVPAVLMAGLVISPTFASIQQAASTPPGQQAEQKPPAGPSAEAVVYKNTRYGFSFSLPEGWKGYTILTSSWEGGDPEKGVVERGPVISMRHPRWTKENPRQDIPIMIFTVAQWASIERGDLSVSAAGFGPSELGRNRKYVFALPPRFNEGDVAGVEEVNQILQHDPLRPFWSK